MRTITQKHMHKYGYKWDGMIPLTEEEARLIAKEGKFTIYRLYEDNTESEVSADEIEDGYLYGIEKESWKNQ